RYELTFAPDHVNVCHCRMCQKASGGAFMAFARIKKERLHWTRGEPAPFRSSRLVERHFCRACGTPLSYHFVETPNISVTVGSLGEPGGVRPEPQDRVERSLSWVPTVAHFPAKRTEELITADLAARFVSYQHPDHDT